MNNIEIVVFLYIILRVIIFIVFFMSILLVVISYSAILIVFCTFKFSSMALSLSLYIMCNGYCAIELRI